MLKHLRHNKKSLATFVLGLQKEARPHTNELVALAHTSQPEPEGLQP